MRIKIAALISAALLTLTWGAQADELIPRYLAPLPPFPLAQVCSDEAFKQACDLIKKGEYDAAYNVAQYLTSSTQSVEQKDAVWALTSVAAEGSKLSHTSSRERIYQLDRKALSMFPSSPYRATRLLRLAIICFADGRFGEAKSWLATFLNDYPEHELANRAALLWCETAITDKDYKEALDALGALKTRVSGDLHSRLLADTAYVLLKLGKPDSTQALWQEVINSGAELGKLPPWALVGLARYLKETGHQKIAFDTLKMVEEKPWQIEAQMLEIIWTSKDERALLNGMRKQWAALAKYHERAKFILPLAVTLSRSNDKNIRAEAKKILEEIKGGAYAPIVRFEAALALAEALNKDGDKLEALFALNELLLNLEENPFASRGFVLYAECFKNLFLSWSESDPLLASALFIKCQKNLSPSLIDEPMWQHIRDTLAKARLFDTLFKLSQWFALRDQYPALAKSMEGLSLALATNPLKGEAILQSLLDSDKYRGFAAHILGMLAWSKGDKQKAIELWKTASSYDDEHGKSARSRLLVALLELKRNQDIIQFSTDENLTASDKLMVAIAFERTQKTDQAFDIWQSLEVKNAYPKNLVQIKMDRSEALLEPWSTLSVLYNQTSAQALTSRRN